MSATAGQDTLDTDATRPGGPGRIPALDGLRAVAVLAVMLFHTSSAPLVGGFLGVDVFFVLSGFLIAGILLDQREYTGRVRLGDFWLRRARRLAPALLLLLLLLCLARLAVPHPQAETWRADILAALTYTTNWFQIASGADYFNQFGVQSPLLHTWSLAIEEQFYLGFALFLVLVLKRASLRMCVITFTALAVVSAAWMFSLSSHQPVWAYYSTGTRVQALLVGAALAGLVRLSGPWWSPRASPLRSVTGWLGVAGLAAAFTLHIPTQTMFRGGFLVVALATGAVIWGALGSTSKANILAWRPLVALGVISYGVYLWHWPVFLWLQARGEAPVTRQVWAMVVSIGLAAASYALVEKPLRQGWFTALPVRAQWGLYAIAAVVVAGLALFPARTLPADETLTWPIAEAVPERIFVGGDSTMFALGSRFPLDRYPGTEIGGPTAIGCGLIKGPYIHEGVQIDPTDCYDWPAAWRVEMDQRDPQVSVIGSLVWDTFDRAIGGAGYAPGTTEFDDTYVAAFREAIDVAGASGRVPVYVLGVPCMDALIDQSILNDAKRTQYLAGLVRRAASDVPNAHYVDLAGLTCRGDGTAIVFRDGRQLRDDGVHWTQAGADDVWSWVLNQMVADGVPGRGATPSMTP